MPVFDLGVTEYLQLSCVNVESSIGFSCEFFFHV